MPDVTDIRVLVFSPPARKRVDTRVRPAYDRAKLRGCQAATVLSLDDWIAWGLRRAISDRNVRGDQRASGRLQLVFSRFRWVVECDDGPSGTWRCVTVFEPSRAAKRGRREDVAPRNGRWNFRRFDQALND